MRSTHTKALEAEANIMPLAIRRQLLCDKIVAKTFSSKHSTSKKLLKSIYPISQPSPKQIIHNSVNKVLSLPIETYNVHPSFLFHPIPNFSSPKVILPDINRGTENVQRIINDHLSRNSDFCSIYTDGSKSSNKVGAAIWIPRYNIEGSFQLNCMASVYSAEIRAILEALEFCFNLDETKFIIISDSRSVISAISHYTNKKARPEIYQIKNLIWQLRKMNKSVHFLWVPSHMGVEGNEYVDSLAKSVPVTLNSINIHYHDLQELFKRHSIQSWQREWECSTMGRYFFEIKPKINVSPWFYDCLLNRGVISTINRLRLNHNSTNFHLHRKNIIASPVCDCGLDIETPDHNLFQCILTDNVNRKPFIENIKAKFNISNVNLLNILKNGHPNVYHELANYLTITGTKL